VSKVRQPSLVGFVISGDRIRTWAFKLFPAAKFPGKCQAVSFFMMGNGNCLDIPVDRTPRPQEEIL
jgi:hypothetical protein